MAEIHPGKPVGVSLHAMDCSSERGPTGCHGSREGKLGVCVCVCF